MKLLDVENLYKMRDEVIEKKKHLPFSVLEKLEKSFLIEYTHNSTAIEGNTLTLAETKLVLEDKISVGGKSLREIYEIINHEKAYIFIERQIAEKQKLDENILKDIHHILMENIIQGGIYRDCEVKITGAKHKPPSANEAYYQMKNFIADLYSENIENFIVLAAYTHAEFVKIHPFVNGNGRVARLIMNYRLMENEFLPISISQENRLKYYDILENYALNGDVVPFSEMIFELEKKRLQEYLEV
ncbi:MAG: Fic family protein [Chitinivibrionia bacterium]|nr:Fic family protein [Chitinivibrionia bacterium]